MDKTGGGVLSANGREWTRILGGWGFLQKETKAAKGGGGKVESRKRKAEMGVGGGRPPAFAPSYGGQAGLLTTDLGEGD
jgi:hypothetical protein